MSRIGAIVLIVVSASASLFAQEHRGQFFGQLGWARTTDDESSLGGGAAYAVGISYRLAGWFGVEFEVTRIHHSRDNASEESLYEGRSLFAVGNGVFYLTRGRGQFYLAGGAGRLRYTGRSGSLPDERSGAGLALDAGGGIKIWVSPHVSIRPDVRYYMGRAGDAFEPWLGALRLSFGAGYEW